LPDSVTSIASAALEPISTSAQPAMLLLATCSAALPAPLAASTAMDPPAVQISASSAMLNAPLASIWQLIAHHARLVEAIRPISMITRLSATLNA